jgi:hypothetical protein
LDVPDQSSQAVRVYGNEKKHLAVKTHWAADGNFCAIVVVIFRT